MNKKIKKIIIKWKFEKYFDLMNYFFIFLKEKNISYPELVNEQNLRNIRNVLILSPHQDDEWFGAGGTILKLIKQKSKINIIWFTNKDNEIRKKESEKLLSELNLDNKIEPFPNSGQHIYISDAIKILKHAITKINPDCIFLPSIFDSHHDHIKLNISLAEVLKKIDWQGKICGFEVWNSLVPNILIDISKEIKTKQKLMKIYKSQLKEPERKYIERIICLNKYRGLSHKVEFAEGFMMFNEKEFINFFKREKTK